MTKDEALRKAQREIWDKGPFFQTEMAQYAIQLGFDKGVEWKEQELFNKVVDFMINCPRYLYIEKDCCGNYYFNRVSFLEDLKRAIKNEGEES